MRVYRDASQEFATNSLFPAYQHDGVWYEDNQFTKKCRLQPKVGTMVHTGDADSFEEITIGTTVIEHDKYYKLDSIDLDANTGDGTAVWVNVPTGRVAVYDIMECQYTGAVMGKRSVVATIKDSVPIDFRIGDYIELEMQSLIRGNDKSGSVQFERFYVYTEPQCKKTARRESAGDAFETTVTFYPRQYELGCIKIRDFVQEGANSDTIIYTGFDTVSFYGGAKELLDRCMACLEQQFVGNDGQPLWKYDLADSVNEEINTSLERYAFSFKDNSVMDALMKLNSDDYINTTFFINGRTIYVGYKTPYLCKVTSQGAIDNTPLKLMYGKTSHEPIDLDHGGLFNITKSVGEEMPITKLFAYGASRNLNRYYCSDRIKSGRYVNKLMLPSFNDDGRTDYIISQDGVRKYGIREGSKEFEEIYPSLRYITYADIRGIKYCIKVKTCGLESDEWTDGIMEHYNSRSSYPIARVQCYKVTPCDGTNGTTIGVNTLVECAPPEDLAVFVHATGKVVKVVLMADDGETPSDPNVPRSVERQIAHDGVWSNGNGRVPVRDALHGTEYIPGSCFLVHDNGWADMDGTQHTSADRDSWFDTTPQRISDTDSINPGSLQQQEAELHRIEYVDTFWLTDLYVFESYNQEYFNRDGYSAWAWPRLNNQSIYPDSWLVNEIVDVEPIILQDTSYNSTYRQTTWDIYLRDIGFAIDEQNDFGEMVFVFDTPKVSMLDGILAGREFTIDGGDRLNDFTDRVVCAYREDGTQNPDFFTKDNSENTNVPNRAFAEGALWRIRLNRQNASELESLGIILPNIDLEAKTGDHIVLLDIYMPDVYVRAAEQRLLREARKYLSRNDRGNVKYAINFDKVRIQQIQNYALQMREGITLRLVDDDLNIKSDNLIKKILDYAPAIGYQVPLYQESIEVITNNKRTLYQHSNPYNPDIHQYVSDAIISQEQVSGSIYKAYAEVQRLQNSSFSKIEAQKYNADGSRTWQELDVISFEATQLKRYRETYIGSKRVVEEYYIDGWLILFEYDRTVFGNISDRQQDMFYVTEEISKANVIRTKTQGLSCDAICNDFIDFMSGKIYDVTIDVNDSFVESENKWLYLSPSKGELTNAYVLKPGNNCVLDETGQADDSGYTRRKYTFRLDNSFNDSIGYYIGVKYLQDGQTDTSYIKMVSVVEKDIDEQGNVVNYVDFIASEVNIKITDNSRPADRRILDCYPEPIYEVTAKIAEQTHASSWASVMNELNEQEIETEKNKANYEVLANYARQNYEQLLNLKTNIFDPDGNCKDTFLQVMMMQVGADSMNYQLDKTFTTPTGITSNFVVTEKTLQQPNQHFTVNEDDVLHHYVYTQGAGNAGTWIIPGNFDAELAPNQDGTWPVYYVCIKCKKDGINDTDEPAWICSTKQYAVNDDEDTDYWYFNWGILAPDSNGNYALTETRGNAYMYGDNIIAGKISTLAGNSYFDLTHGNFVLSRGTENDAALSYINGVLTIKGINDDSMTSILSRLGLLENVVVSDGVPNLYPYYSRENKCGKIIGSDSDGIIFEIDGRNYPELCTNGHFKNDAFVLDLNYNIDINVTESDDELEKITLYYQLANDDLSVRSERSEIANQEPFDTEFEIAFNGHLTIPVKDASLYSRLLIGILGGGENDVHQIDIESTIDAKFDRIILQQSEVAPKEYKVPFLSDNICGNKDFLLEGYGDGDMHKVVVGPDAGTFDDAHAVNTNLLVNGATYIVTANYIANDIELRAWGHDFAVDDLKIGLREVGTYYVSNTQILKSRAYGDDQIGSYTRGNAVRGKITVPSDNKKYELVVIHDPYPNPDPHDQDYRILNVTELEVHREDYVSNDYLGHVKDALHGSTEIAGGLVLTNLIMLKDEFNMVNAGMSGLRDDGPKEVIIGGQTQTVNSQGVTLWAGGSYDDALKQAEGLVDQLTQLLPVLITKTGIGSKIGCFEVVDNKTIQVVNNNNKIIFNAGDEIYPPYISMVQNGEEKIRISPEQILKNSVYGKSITLDYKPTAPNGVLIDSEGRYTGETHEYLLETLDFSMGINSWTVNRQATHMRIEIYWDKPNLWSGASFNAKLEIGDVILFNGNYTVGAPGTGSAPVYKYYFIPLGSISSITSDEHDIKLTISNFTATIRSSTAYSLYAVVFRSCILVENVGQSDYRQSSINFSTVGSVDIVQIGRNGIQVSHRNGGFMQILNDDAELYVRMFGLPENNASMTDEGVLYMDRANKTVKINTVQQS